MNTDEIRMNADRYQAIPLKVAAHFALYPLGTADYMDTIYEIISLAKDEGTFYESAHYASRLEGDAQRVFATLEHAFNRARKSDKSHVVMTTTMSANSPSTR